MSLFVRVRGVSCVILFGREERCGVCWGSDMGIVWDYWGREGKCGGMIVWCWLVVFRILF